MDKPRFEGRGNTIQAEEMTPLIHSTLSPREMEKVNQGRVGFWRGEFEEVENGKHC